MRIKRRIVLARASAKEPLSSEYLTFIQSITQNNLGEVLKSDSKGFTLSFGARKTRESDIERALLVCLAIKDHVDNIKFGVSYGLVSIDEKKDGKIRIEGKLTQTVSHLLNVAAWGQISTDQSISKIYSRIFDIRRLKVKNKEILNVFGFKEVPSRIRGLKEAYSKLIGRDKEFAALENLVLQIAADQGQMAGVSGEAGIGKTRITHELKTILGLRGIKFFEGAFPYFGGSTYKGFKDIISQIAGILPTDSPHALDKKLLRIGKKYGLEITDVNFLTNMYSLAPVSDTLKHLNEEQIKLGTFVAVKKLLFAISEDPLVVILEDMQNADTLSVDLCNFIAEGLPNKKLLFYMNYRPEFCADFEQKIYFNPIKLQRFDEEQAREFLSSILDIEYIPKPLLRLILKKSAGNPLYIEELVRSLLDKGKIQVVANELKLTEEISTKDIQPTIHGVISYRMERLPAFTREVLKWGSAVGDEVDIKLLKTILQKDISKDVEELELKDFIVEKCIYPAEIYRFRHDLIREVAYESLPLNKKKQIHLKIGNYLEKKFKREIDEHMEEIANHFVNSSDYDKGFNYAYRAAKKLKDNYSNDEAIRFFNEAFKLADKAKLKDSYETKKEILESLKDIYVLTNKVEPALKTAEQYKKMLKKDDLRGLCFYHSMMGEINNISGNFEIADNNFNKAIDIAKKLGDTDIQTKCLVPAVRFYSFKGDHVKAKEYCKLILMTAREEQKRERAKAKERLGFVYHQEGKYEKAINCFNESLRIYKEIESHDDIMSIYLNLGRTFGSTRNSHEAISYFTKSISIADKIGSLATKGLLHQNLAVHYSRLGLIKKAFYQYFLAERILKEINRPSYLLMVYSNLSDEYLCLGDTDKATEYLIKSNDLLKNSPAKFWVGQNFIIEGRIKSSEKKYDDAEVLFNKAISVYNELNDFTKIIDVTCHQIDLYFKFSNIEKLKNKIGAILNIDQAISEISREKILCAKLKASILLKNGKNFINVEELNSIDKFEDFHNKLEAYALVSQFHSNIKLPKNLSEYFKSKFNDFLNRLTREVDVNLKDKIEQKFLKF